MSLSIHCLGDRALVIHLGSHISTDSSTRVLSAWRTLTQARVPGVIDLVPAYTSLTVHYDGQAMPDHAQVEPWRWLADRLQEVLSHDQADQPAPGRTVEIPVCYGGTCGPDLESVATALGLSANEVIHRHGKGDYQVAFLGFRPGFPYLLGLDPSLALPRLDTPRARVDAGSVGIGGGQTGIYANDGPGGWHLLGRTPLRLFDPQREPPTLLAPGDRLRFRAIDADTFQHRHDQTYRIAHRPHAHEPGEDALDVLQPGIHTSMQDSGRPGWRHLGIAAGGVSDPVAATIVNTLVGNPGHAPVLELTLRGPELRLLRPLTIALAGSGMDAFADDRALPFGQPITLSADTVLHFRSTGLGARTWLAVAGGFAAACWLDSASADFGSGLFGRALRAGDRLRAWPAMPMPASANWWVEARAEIDAPMILRYLIDDSADPVWQQELPSRVWRVTLAADRTGVRLSGPPLSAAKQPSRISTGVLHGTVQVPPDGQPILLGPDGQTTGGYPMAGHIIQADLPRLAQLKPGDLAWLQPTTLAEAHAARRAQAAVVARMQLAIGHRLRRPF